MWSRAASTSSILDSTTAFRPTHRKPSAPSTIAREQRPSRFSSVGQRRGQRLWTRIRPAPSRRYQVAAWWGSPSGPAVAIVATRGASRNARTRDGSSAAGGSCSSDLGITLDGTGSAGFGSPVANLLDRGAVEVEGPDGPVGPEAGPLVEAASGRVRGEDPQDDRAESGRREVGQRRVAGGPSE